MSSSRRPSLVAKRTHVRAAKHLAITPPDLPTPPRTLDRIIVGLGYAGLATYLFASHRKFISWELAGLGLGSLTIGYSLFDLGKRTGIIHGASFALRNSEEKRESLKNDEDWKEEYQGMEFETLKKADKIAWLRKEEKRIHEVQAEEQAECGLAYIEKEEAYKDYEKRGGYGGETWKRYSAADDLCQEIYRKWELQQQRLRQIRKEINSLSEEI
ncbi:hypothetical protein VTL71DRAFT_3765 [Oculimacula yallundae]|uniref:Uncharacterized protein n=1 Tax=Oculimacula yallundae TaxID=86028 RepID=A0ABR4C6C5_9HELO